MHLECKHRNLRPESTLAVAIFVLIIMPACVPWLPWPPTESAFKPNTQTTIEKTITDFQSYNEVPGMIVGVWTPGQGSFVKGFGVANRYTGRAIQPTDKVRIGSLTKSFTMTLILQLADEGKLSLDDPVSKYTNLVPNGDKITLRQLGNMTSGLYNYTDTAGYQAGYLRPWTPEELVQVAVTYPPKFAPGQGWDYCNTNYILLGLIVEKVTGNPIGDEMPEKRIFGPLGMDNTTFATTAEISGEYARGYCTSFTTSGLLEDVSLWPFYQSAWAAGANVSTLADMKTWIRALATGQLISEKSHQEQITWVEAHDGQQYGLAMFKSGAWIGHDGSIPGYNSVAIYLPEQDAAIVLFLTRDPGVHEGAMELALKLGKILFPDSAP